ncbi:flavocytochrome c [Helicobacter sp. 11S02629-2]|uniref:flavocytochrome c n=1 Tax=Helicobacter sp. 11S02629-2 TaxID=1476195 RepID=UPI000BA5351A|nr:flavocytochrome c [Helicobacter sp. 11S02629-2]PAF44366.1 hypothetical protein BKH40_05580 [Helicobacter sp. 11S02629-2]
MVKNDRRSALKTLACCSAALMLPSMAFGKMFEKDVPRWDESFDAIVVGTGYAGSAAMLSLFRNGVKGAIMIDKMPYLGGNSAYSGGSLAASETPDQAREGIKDSHALHYQDTMKSGHNLNDPALVKLMVDQSPVILQWLKDNGVKFINVGRSGGHSVRRSHATGVGSYITRPLQKKILDEGGKIRNRVIMDEIIYNAKGEVVGIKVREKYQFNFERGFDENENKSGQVKYYRAYGGIIVATGGWAADLKFRQKMDPKLRPDVLTTNHLGATAYTIEKLMSDGVKVVDMQYIQSMHVTSQDEGSFGYGYRWITKAYVYGMMVNPKTGLRFMNEIADRKVGSDAILKMNEGGKNPPVLIMDIDGTKTVDLAQLQRGMMVDAVKQFETMDELIDYYHINKKPFLEQLKRYNGFVDAAAKDPNYRDPEFGRNFSDYKGKFIKVEKPPFFAARPGPKVHHCMGGVKTTIDCEVYNDKLQIIPGFYAAGEVTGGRHGYNRLGSNAVLDCCLFGQRAGAALARRYDKLRSI